MQSRSNRPKRKSHLGRKILITLLSIIIVLGLIGAAGVALERYIVHRETNALVAKIIPSSTLDSLKNTTVSAISPADLAKELNNYADSIKSNSSGLIDSAKATQSGGTVTYTVSSGKLNSLTANALVTANGDSLQTIADKALEAMQKSGESNPKVVVQLTNSSGTVIKILTYTK